MLINSRLHDYTLANQGSRAKREVLIIGLGNPGEKYKNTRHNIGFRIINEFKEKNNFPEFEFSKKFNALVSENTISGKKIILVKPQTFMNESGKSVKSLINFYKISNKNLIIINDDIDLLLGKIKIVKNRGSAGHKGVESIIKEIGTKNIIRFRIGILPLKGKPKNPERFVLQEFSKEEIKTVEEIIKKTVEAISVLSEEGIEEAMNKYNN